MWRVPPKRDQGRQTEGEGSSSETINEFRGGWMGRWMGWTRMNAVWHVEM